MNKISEFINGLKKSTKITLLSCGSFVVLTLLILVFFIAFPITPSEKVMSNIGRGENIFKQGEEIQTSTTVVSAASSPVSNTTTQTVRTTASRRTSAKTLTSVNIVITTGSGFSMNGRIPTGEMPYGDNTETTPIEGQTDPNGDRPYNPYEHDPNGLFTQPTTTPNVQNPDPNVQNPDPNVQNPDPNVQNPDPNVQNPDPNVQNPDPNTQNPDPNVQNPDHVVPPEGGGEQTPAGN